MKKIFIVVGLLNMISCTIVTQRHSQRYILTQMQRVESCENAYVYKKLTDSTALKVLFFFAYQKKHLNYFPNFIIGIAQSGDTIGLIDKDFRGKIKVNEVIVASPSEWTDNIKSAYPIPLTIGSEKVNKLFCKIKIVYYGKIKPLSRWH